ncbi:MAG: endolytic transglycosylase MltG [Myxococcales bacterium]|nr:endolytic transglycosylase MltG [Myxococcales bacterium]
MLALLCGAAIVAFSALRYPKRALRPADAHKVKIVVTRGMTASAIGRALAERGVIDRPSWFRFYATERGDAQKVRPGQYTFGPSMSPSQILDALVAGVPEEEVAVTLPEGRNLIEIAALLEEGGVCPRAEFERAARDAALMRQLGVPGETFEGYLYPDRYLFRPATPAPKVIARLVKHGKEVFAELRESHKAGVAALQKSHKFDDHQIVLMASLVEEETAEPSERPRIAGVFLNRLRLATFKPHLLQTDPTITYGCTVPVVKSAACQKYEGRIRRIHLDDKDNPYNTYTHEGLPPGPICNPGRAALLAVMQPETTPYLYFVAKNDGTHYFSKSVAEHEAAVDKYIRGHGGT